MSQHFRNAIASRGLQIPHGMVGSDPLLNLEKWLLVMHQIQDHDYKFRKKLFFTSTYDEIPDADLPGDKEIPWTEVKYYVAQRACGFDNVVFQVNFDDLLHNDEIALLDEDIAPSPGTSILPFSMYLFEALTTYFADIDKVCVTKAISLIGGPGGQSIAFRLVDTAGKDLYYADLSGVYP